LRQCVIQRPVTAGLALAGGGVNELVGAVAWSVAGESRGSGRNSFI